MSSAVFKDKNFSVIFFNSENRYSVVPTTWLVEVEGKNQCYWPGPKTKHANQLIQQADSQPAVNWTLHPIEYLKGYDSYEKATKKAENLKKSVGLEIPSSDGETSFSAEFLVPPLPSQSGHRSTDAAMNEEYNLSGSPNQAASGQEVLQVTVDGILELREEFKAFQIESIGAQQELLAEIRDVKKILRQLTANTTTEKTDQDNQNKDSYPALPLKTLQEFQETEGIIQEVEQYKLLVKELRRIGGPTVAKTVFNTLRQLMTKELAGKVRLTSSTGKTAIGGTKLEKAVKEAVQALWGDKEASTSVITGHIGSYLRGTLERKKNGNTKKNQETPNTSFGPGNLVQDQEESNSEPEGD